MFMNAQGSKMTGPIPQKSYHSSYDGKVLEHSEAEKLQTGLSANADPVH